jgi:proline dehydrogenase
MGLDRELLFKLATNRQFERLVKTVPGGRNRAWRAANRYVAGQSETEAFATVSQLLANGHGISLDLYGELVTDLDSAMNVAEKYQQLAESLPSDLAGAWLSIDLTHLALDVDPSGTADRLEAIASSLPVGRRVQVGAEDGHRTDAVLACITEVAARGHSDRLGATVQANLLRSPGDLDALIDAGVHVRLVKGAYVEYEDVHPFGKPTDAAFVRLADWLVENRHPWAMATHDARLREMILADAEPDTLEIEQLLGVLPDELVGLRARGFSTRVYVPYGPNWFRYWMRRVAEARGA